VKENEPIRLVVPPALDALRLDRVLSQLIASVSRAELARWIEAGNVRVDERPETRPSAKVRAGKALVVHPMPPPPSDAAPDPSVVFGVLYEDDAIVVVDKPGGLVVHPSKGHATGTLVNGLLARGALAPPEEGAALPRPGIVHRIDKGTSGVLVVARTAPARERLKACFAAHDIERVYDAIAVGTLPDLPELTFDTAYGRHPTDRKAFTGRPRSGGKRAVTHVRVVERFEGACRLECRLETGRTHQIRVHLAEAGAPLLGDPLYGRAPKSPALRAIAHTLGRQALHARVLGFSHPVTHEHVRFEAPWPDDFRAAVEALRALSADRVDRPDRPEAGTSKRAPAPARSKRSR
jgi:23S rRNA pseudouridine1911/1915/1917 synthase